MSTPAEMILQDIQDRYVGVPVDSAFTRLYPDAAAWNRMFADFHQQLNAHFSFMNTKASVNRHFNADDSRQLLDLIAEIDRARTLLRRAGVDFEVDPRYQDVLDECAKFLTRSGGSAIPDEFQPIDLIAYEPMFVRGDAQIAIPDRRDRVDLKLVGSGAYANVYRFTDPVYDVPIAVKRAKRDLDQKDLVRFRGEFSLLKGLRSPYVLDVYKYADDRDEYTMEFCDGTLRKFIDKNNAGLGPATRRRIVLQFLYGMNYLHSKGHLHRDVSLQNVLVKQYDGAVVVVKLSDFGLTKERDSELTKTESELRGTIVDPTIVSFKEYSTANEIYAIGFVLSFIFSGRQAIDACSGPVRRIVDRCVSHDVSARYPDVISIIRDVELVRS